MTIRETREQQLRYHRDYYQRNRERLLVASRAYKASNPELIKEGTRRHRTRKRNGILEKQNTLKVEVMTHYGSGVCACSKCGYSDMRALVLDHTNNDGAAERNHRRDYYMTGHYLYKSVSERGYPDGYQTLCFNCHAIKHRELRDAKLSFEPRLKRGKNRQ